MFRAKSGLLLPRTTSSTIPRALTLRRMARSTLAATAVRGVRDGDTIEWATVVRTERIPPGTKNHPHPAIVLSPDDRFVYINSGSRTDHGELAEEGAFAGARELPLSSAILRVPADGEDLLIPAAEEALLRRIVRRWGWSLM